MWVVPMFMLRLFCSLALMVVVGRLLKAIYLKYSFIIHICLLMRASQATNCHIVHIWMVMFLLITAQEEHLLLLNIVNHMKCKLIYHYFWDVALFSCFISTRHRYHKLRYMCYAQSLKVYISVKGMPIHNWQINANYTSIIFIHQYVLTSVTFAMNAGWCTFSHQYRDASYL